MASLRIPESDYNGLAALLTLKDESRAELINALGEMPSSPTEDELVETISSKAKTIVPDIAALIAKVIISLSCGRIFLDSSIAEFAKAICEAMEESGVEALKLGDERDRFEAFLVKILSFDSLSALMKAQTILHEYEHLWCNGRILTDLRPVFGSGSLDEVTGMGIVHNLRIRYHEAGDIKEIFVAMDSEELEELAEMVERAQTKEETLRSVLTKAGIAEIET
jgi:transcriptional regulator of NAD metabolism